MIDNVGKALIKILSRYVGKTLEREGNSVEGVKKLITVLRRI